VPRAKEVVPMSQREKTAVVIFRAFGCCVFLLRVFDAAGSLASNVLCRSSIFDPGIIFNLIPFSFYAAAGVVLFALSKPLARLVVRGIGYD
jgi:hypothetical protein